MTDDKKKEDKPKAIKGAKHKHQTWGSNDRRNPDYKPKHEKK